MRQKIIVGIDEVGRGPLAGPVSVGIVACKTHFVIDGITDSKLMTEAARERVYKLAKEMMRRGELIFGVYSTTASYIDRGGIEVAIADAIQRGLAELAPDTTKVELVLDGHLKAPAEYRQQSLIHGDALVPAISLAAIVAKVERDRYMSGKAHKAYPQYAFDEHKGYGTLTHIKNIRIHGMSPLHRRSFLRNIVLESRHG